MSQENFYTTTSIVFAIVTYICNIITVLVAGFGLIFIGFTKRCNRLNQSLVVLNAIIFVQATALIIPFSKQEPNLIFEAALYFVYVVSLNLAHWAVSYVYLKASIEMNAMLDRNIHMNN